MNDLVDLSIKPGKKHKDQGFNEMSEAQYQDSRQKYSKTLRQFPPYSRAGGIRDNSSDNQQEIQGER